MTFTAVGAGLCLASSSAASQQRVGSVRDAVTNAGIPGAVVMLLGAHREALARTLSGPTGSFRIRADDASIVRVVRIGYFPYEGPLERRGAPALDVVMTPLGTRLRPVDVRANPVCPRRVDQGEALAMWSAATDALSAIATAASDQVQSGSVTQILFDRLLDGNGRRIVSQSTRRVTTANVNPIRADRSAGELARVGYLERRQGGVVYYGPDANTLLAPSFAATHCLSIRRDNTRHRGEIGVAFAPVRGRDTLADIAGVLWLSTLPIGLDALDFEYRGVDPAMLDAHAGGRIEFESLSNGVPIISYWHIRAPKLLYLPAGRATRRGVEVEGQVATPGELHEGGGLIASGMLADGTTWSMPLAALKGRVVDSNTGEGVHSVMVSLDSTDRDTHTDREGGFAFEELLPGPYSVRMQDSVAIPEFRIGEDGALAPDTVVQQVVKQVAVVKVEATIGQMAIANLTLPRRTTVEGCLGTRDDELRPVVLGEVITPDSVAVDSAFLSLTWAERRSPEVRTVIEAHTHDHGTFVVCGLPTSVSITAEVTSPSGVVYAGRLQVPRDAPEKAPRMTRSGLRRVTLIVSREPPRGVP
jgi:Carboxypeptidase regulatory-like domain